MNNGILRKLQFFSSTFGSKAFHITLYIFITELFTKTVSVANVKLAKQWTLNNKAEKLLTPKTPRRKVDESYNGMAPVVYGGILALKSE